MNYQNLIFPILLILFFAYKFYRNKKIKNEIPLLLNQGAIIVDVRSPSEFSAGANPKSINISLDKINNECQKLDKNKPIILCCASGTRSGMAHGILKKNGFKNVVNAGPWTNTLT